MGRKKRKRAQDEQQEEDGDDGGAATPAAGGEAPPQPSSLLLKSKKKKKKKRRRTAETETEEVEGERYHSDAGGDGDEEPALELEGAFVRGFMYLIDRMRGTVYDADRDGDGNLVRAGSVGENGELVIDYEKFPSRYPYDVDQDDHCETPQDAYEDVDPILSELARSRGKSKSALAIYDPFFCQGSVVKRLEVLGFENVYNRKEDFYKKKDAPPEHDVLLTNPPYSADHIQNVVEYCCASSKPWLLLLPSFVYMKDYYKEAVIACEKKGGVLLIAPPRRYSYHSPKDCRSNVKAGARKTSPFTSFWYVYCGSKALTEKVIEALGSVDAERRCVACRRPEDLPYKLMDSNDPVRKKARDRERSERRKKKPK